MFPIRWDAESSHLRRQFRGFARRVLQIYHQTTHPASDILLGEARQRSLRPDKNQKLKLGAA
jgi:hypothetical protein